MRLGKEQAVGVVEEPAGADSAPLEEPRGGDADQLRLVEAVPGDTSSGRPGQAPLIPSR
jgi:hypothetical protein